MSLSPVSPHWIHVYLVEPYLQGAELCNLAIRGEDFSLRPNKLSLKERIICFLQGSVLLLFPLVNSVIWIAWKTFGKPEELADRFSENPLPIYQPPIRVNSLLRTHENASQLLEKEEIYFHQKTDGHVTEWNLRHYSDRIETTQTSAWHKSAPNGYVNQANYTKEKELTDIHYFYSGKHIVMHREEDHIHLKIIQADGKTEIHQIPFNKDFNWVQQRVSFENLIPANQEKGEFTFHAVVPEYPISVPSWMATSPPYAIEFKAVIGPIEEVEGFGPLQKLTVQSTWGWPYNILKSEMWFDPKTYELKKFSDTFDGASRPLKWILDQCLTPTVGIYSQTDPTIE